VTDGLQLFPNNVLFFILGAPKSSSLEALVQNRAPNVARLVRVEVRGLDMLVDGRAA
jgi:predicted AAA+ superfamily ATPase